MSALGFAVYALACFGVIVGLELWYRRRDRIANEQALLRAWRIQVERDRMRAHALAEVLPDDTTQPATPHKREG